LAKAVIFGLLYEQGAKGLAIYAKRQYGVDMTEEEAEQHRNGLFRIYKGLRKWQMATGRHVEITKKVRTPCGRERDFSRERLGYRSCVKSTYSRSCRGNNFACSHSIISYYL
jgi:DNA polymerase I-like protein with 3'-5' exonuclease and polymerase domains